MGLLNNFLHKKQKKEQLSKIGEKKAAPVVAAKEKEVKKEVKAKSHDHADHDHAGHTHAESKSENKVKASDYSLAFKILVKPLVTEKSAIAQGKNNKYSFVVAKSANKDQIKKAIEEVFGVKAVSVNVANIEGRRVRFGRSMGRRSDYKKAVITLPEGKTIDIHTGV